MTVTDHTVLRKMELDKRPVSWVFTETILHIMKGRRTVLPHPHHTPLKLFRQIKPALLMHVEDQKEGSLPFSSTYPLKKAQAWGRTDSVWL